MSQEGLKTTNPITHRERLRPFLDDEALYEVREDVGFDHSLGGRSSLPLAADPTRHCQHRGGGGGGRRRRSARAWWGGEGFDGIGRER